MVEDEIDSGAPLGCSLLITDLTEESTYSGRPKDVGGGVAVGSPLIMELINDERTKSGRPLLAHVAVAECWLKRDDLCIDRMDFGTTHEKGVDGRVRSGDEVISVL